MTILSDALPVQFWFEGYDTFNEEERFGQNQVCWKAPIECDQDITIQLYDSRSGLAFTLEIYDEDDTLLDTLTLPEVSGNLYQRTINLSNNTPDICDTTIWFQIKLGGSAYARTDYLEVKAEHEGTILISYSNHRNYAGLINQQTSPDTTFYLRIPATFNEKQMLEEDQVLPLSNNRIISLTSQVKKQRFLETDQMPMYMHLKVMEALKHQFVEIEELEYVKEDAYTQSPNSNKKWPLRAYTCWLTEKAYVLRNVL
jgi:hypothetical protein